MGFRVVQVPSHVHVPSPAPHVPPFPPPPCSNHTGCRDAKPSALMYSTKDRRSSVNRTLSAPDLVGKVGAHAVRTPRAPQSFVVGRLVPKATDRPRGQLLVEVEGIYACADINRRICEEGPLVVLAFVRQWQQQHPHSRTKVRDLHNRLRDLKERRPSWRHSEMERGAKKEIEAHAHGGLQPDLAVLFMGRREFLLEPPKEWKGPKDRSYWLLGNPKGHMRPGGEF